MDIAVWLLRISGGLTMVVFGINQIRKPEPWKEYFPKAFEKLLSFHPVIKVHAVFNIILGVLLLSGWYPIIGSWLAFLWWLSIVPFAFQGSWKTGMRDLSITLAMAALAVLVSL